MFDSGIKIRDIIEELYSEVDIALEIPNKTYIEWFNALQQLLYSEIIKEQRKTVLSPPYNSPIAISSIEPESNENNPRFEDIHTIYAKNSNDFDIQLHKTSVTSGSIFPNTYFKENNNIGINIEFEPAEIRIIYFVKPALVTVSETDVISDDNVMIPVEFIDLVKSKLRGEAYKLANEDNLAAKWLNDYNTHLETFRAWMAEKSANFGR